MARIIEKMKGLSWPLSTFILSLLTMLVIRIQYINTVCLDSGIYLGVANNIANGHILYKEIPESKPPLFHLLNALLVSIEGTNYLNIFLAFAFVSGLIALVVFLLIRELTSSDWCAFLGAIAFSVFSSLPISEIYWIMTEPYLILFNLTALLFYLRGVKSRSPYTFFLVGFFLSCAFLVRQTSVLFLFTIVAFILYDLVKTKVKATEFLMICVGTVPPFVSFLVYFLSVGGLVQAIDAVFLTAASDTIAHVSNIPRIMKLGWLLDVVASALPLIGLAILGLLKFKDKEPRTNWTVGVLLAWVLIVVLYYLLTPFGPGFHHEYAEVIGPLAVLAGLGLHEIGLYIRENNIHLSISWPSKGASTMPLLVLIIPALICASVLSSVASVNVVSSQPDDMKVVREVSSFLNENTLVDEPIYVFETQMPKIGPLIYFESDREPVTLNRSVLFPSDITDRDCQYTIDSLRSDKIVYVIVIGGEPPEEFGYQNAHRIYDQITSDYYLLTTLDRYSPYPGSAENLTVEIYKKKA